MSWNKMKTFIKKKIYATSTPIEPYLRKKQMSWKYDCAFA